MSDDNEIPNDNDRYYMWGIFYFNPRDKRIFPPKKGGVGYTTNFANPFSIAVLILIVVILLAPIIFSKFLSRFSN